MSIGFINTAKTIEVFVNGNCYTVTNDDPIYRKVVDLIRKNDPDQLEDALLNQNVSSLKKAAKIQYPGLLYDDSTPVPRLLWNDVEIHGTMVDRLIQNDEMGLPLDNIFNFIERVMKSGDSVLISDLYTFLEYGKLPITSEGTFWAYKVVRSDYMDKHTGKMDNSVGTVVEMPRGRVDNNRDNTCSSGLHFCSFEYLSQFYSRGDRIVKVEVCPEDVVSIPTDYNNTKARACRYKIVEDMTELVYPEDATTFGNVLSIGGDDELEEQEEMTSKDIRAAVGILRSLVRAVGAELDDDEDDELDYEDVVDCPSCGSESLRNKGTYSRADGTVMQRYSCKDCGTGFSVPQ